MSKKLKSVTNEWGVTTEYHAEDDKFIVRTTQNLEPILEANKQAQNAISSKATTRYPGETFHKIGSIPHEVYEHWRKVEGVDLLKLSADEAEKFILRKLNSDTFLRTVPWRV